jgi:hypothetical protein
MKYQIFIATLLTLSGLNGQSALKSTYNPTANPPEEAGFGMHKGDWSTEATLLIQTGNAAIRVGVQEIKVRKYLQNDYVFRTRLMATQSKEVTIINQGSGLMERSITDFTGMIAPGFEKHQHPNGKYTARLSPYWGAELPIGKHGYEYDLTNSKDGQNYYNGGSFNSKVTKAYSVGLNLIYGIDFYVAHGIFIGTEIGYGMVREKYGVSNITTFDGTYRDNRSIPMGSNSQLNLYFNSGIRFGIVF